VVIIGIGEPGDRGCFSHCSSDSRSLCRDSMPDSARRGSRDSEPGCPLAPREPGIQLTKPTSRPRFVARGRTRRSSAPDGTE